MKNNNNSKMVLYFGGNLRDDVCICGEPTNLYIDNGETQLFTGDEVMIKIEKYNYFLKQDVFTKKPAVVVLCYDNTVKLMTNKEYKIIRETVDNEKVIRDDIKLLRSYKEYKDGEEVANGRKCGGFVAKIIE